MTARLLPSAARTALFAYVGLRLSGTLLHFGDNILHLTSRILIPWEWEHVGLENYAAEREVQVGRAWEPRIDPDLHSDPALSCSASGREGHMLSNTGGDNQDARQRTCATDVSSAIRTRSSSPSKNVAKLASIVTRPGPRESFFAFAQPPPAPTSLERLQQQQALLSTRDPYVETLAGLVQQGSWMIGASGWAELGSLFTNAGTGIGIVLGLGPDANWARQFLQQWKNGVLYLCDPFIHIFNGYDDPEFNVDDRTHQINYENIRVTLMQDTTIQGRYSMVREFSFSFFRLWMKQDPRYEFGDIPPRLVFVDNNPGKDAVLRDMTDWWEILLPGGVMAGARAGHPGVREAVETFAKRNNLEPMLVLEPGDVGWMLLKANDDAANEEYIRRQQEWSTKAKKALEDERAKEEKEKAALGQQQSAPPPEGRRGGEL
ncbi:unnamed protein product [Amoebophrya sp. A25]|nr:unnamed protein product [Amoebophrya sp. A25]|eukprot:GSA25T00016548001.1